MRLLSDTSIAPTSHRCFCPDLCMPGTTYLARARDFVLPTGFEEHLWAHRNPTVIFVKKVRLVINTILTLIIRSLESINDIRIPYRRLWIYLCIPYTICLAGARYFVSGTFWRPDRTAMSWLYWQAKNYVEWKVQAEGRFSETVASTN